MPLEIIRQDITKVKVDAIVNTANTQLYPGSGVCGAVFSAAGAEKLIKACEKIGGCPTGEAVITDGFNLPSKYIIHTVGPVYQDGNQREAYFLESAYEKSLELAKKHKCKSIAFPLISTGVYGYPKAEAVHIATATISKFLMNNEMDVYLVVFDKNSLSASENLMGKINAYIDEHYVESAIDNEYDAFIKRKMEAGLGSAVSGTTIGRVGGGIGPIIGGIISVGNLAKPKKKKTKKDEDEYTEFFGENYFSEENSVEYNKAGPEKDLKVEKRFISADASPKSIPEIIALKDDTFIDIFYAIIREKGYTHVEVYKRANFSRAYYSKFCKNHGLTPMKNTVISFAIALKLDLEETQALLDRAGYILSNNIKFDILIKYFIENKMFDIIKINEILFYYDMELLGGNRKENYNTCTVPL